MHRLQQAKHAAACNSCLALAVQLHLPHATSPTCGVRHHGSPWRGSWPPLLHGGFAAGVSIACPSCTVQRHGGGSQPPVHAAQREAPEGQPGQAQATYKPQQCGWPERSCHRGQQQHGHR